MKSSRAIKHISLHRIASTELRVVADVEEGVLSLIQVEETVIQNYARTDHWPHRCITLFILEDLQPLIRQLGLGASPQNPPASGQPFSAQEMTALNERPMLNIYDLADLTNDNIYVNRNEMVKQGYWSDPRMLRGLLAHEHAHPLAENETTLASRKIRFTFSEVENPNAGISNRKPGFLALLTALAQKLTLLAPREIFANQKTIQSGFAEDLFTLNARNMENARISIEGRKGLSDSLLAEVAQGKLTPAEMDLFLFVGDLNAYLPLALEVSPFYRGGQPDFARSLEKSLESSVFPAIDPLAAHCFTALMETYLVLSAQMSLSQLIDWTQQVLGVICVALAKKGLSLDFQMSITEK